jgi:hypothetical protein
LLSFYLAKIAKVLKTAIICNDFSHLISIAAGAATTPPATVTITREIHDTTRTGIPLFGTPATIYLNMSLVVREI